MRKYKFCQFPRNIPARIYSLFNCGKTKDWKIRTAQNLMQFKVFQKLEFPDYLLHNIIKVIEVMDYIIEHSDCIFWLLSVKLPSFATEHFLIFAFKLSNNHLRGALF